MMYTYGNPDADTVLIQMIDDHDLQVIEEEAEEIRGRTGRDFYLMGIRVGSWNDDLSPWEAPPVFGNAGFGGKADSTLKGLLKFCTDRNRNYYIGGYSLAALFALWAAYQTDLFKGVASASPSMWFPQFTDYMKENRIHADCVYLSLGDREEKTKNPVMASVGERIREAADILKGQDINTILEWNPGNHFKDTGIRTAKAFARVLELESSEGE